MKSRRSTFVSLQWIWIALALAWWWALAYPHGKIPALGPLFDFQYGVWQHHDFKWKNREISGLKQSVMIAVDHSGVPHLFAKNEPDLYLAQGYLMAEQRLFQIDLSTRSAGGRLSELVGGKGLGVDRFFVKLGVRQSEKKTLAAILGEPRTALMVNSLITGVNSYIASLKSPGELPVEYKLLGQTPKFFDALRVVRMDKGMTYSLNGRSDGYILSHLQLSMPTEKILDLFPEFYPADYEEPVVNRTWGSKARPPEEPEQFSFRTHLRNFPDIPQPSFGNGSNNWVVGPAKSKTGHSILANDTHLGLSLPNIWFENQLSCPEFNVYGVTLPLVPGIVNGFNRDIAWGPTNGTTAALDYYEIEFENETSLLYRIVDNDKVGDKGEGDKFEAAEVFNEIIETANHKHETVPVLWTKWGTVLHREGRYGLVANWTGHRANNKLLALRRLYEAHDLKGCLAAFKEWQVPIQNFVCADADHIGIVHAGFIPERNIGEGRFISSPQQTRAALERQVPEELRPLEVDPKTGFLRSANERVTDNTYPNYMGWNYEEPFRGSQIRRLLERQVKLSGEDMMKIQNDDFAPEAERILPILLRELREGELTDLQQGQVVKLRHWDLRDKWDAVEPTVYKAWYAQIKEDLFSDEYNLPERPEFFPRDIRVAWLLARVSANPRDPDAYWVDDKRTPEIETLPMIVTRAFQKAWVTLNRKGGTDPALWIWKNSVQTQLSHIAKIPGFGSGLLAMNGASDSVRGNRGWHGAVYKFVIELGDDLKAWIQVPGGVTGDPFSPDFENNVAQWSEGKMRPVEFYKDLEDAQKRCVQLIEFKPAKDN